MSTSSQPNLPPPSWKQEVNQRLAAHKNRKGSAAQTAFVPNQADGSSRAGQAAARVAARYAKAPSYSDLQAADAAKRTDSPQISDRLAASPLPSPSPDAAPLAFQSASQAARIPADTRPPFVPHSDAHPRSRAAQEPVRKVTRKANASFAAADLAPAPAEYTYSPLSTEAETSAESNPDNRPFDIRWDPDLPYMPSDASGANSREDYPQTFSGWTQREVSATLRNEPIEIAGSQPSQANLIQFPRELVATRKLRPRLAELPPGTVLEQEGRLSIFEVDPQAIAPETSLSAATAVEEAPPATSQANLFPQWTGAARSGAEWSGIELDAHPWAATLPAADPVASVELPRIAPLGWRMMAGVVDAGLIGGAFVLGTFIAAINMHRLPTGKSLEMAAIFGLIATWFVYHALFFSLAKSTPGMKYAGLSLSTMSGKVPNGAQLRSRLGAMALSILPVGFGMVWTLFDEQHLSWHDRISHTYLRLR